MNTNVIDKNKLITRFSRACNTYDDNALIQKEVADHMIRLLDQCLGPDDRAGFHSILEVGCGTGYYSNLLRRDFHPKRFYLNDICEMMRPFFKDFDPETTFFRMGDAERIDFPENLDLITSCSAIQWFEDLNVFLEKCMKAMRPGAFLALSTFAPDNFHEARELTGLGLEYLGIIELRELIGKHFDLLHIEDIALVQFFESPQAVLQHFKKTGVTATNNTTWNKSKLRDFIDEYNRRYLKDGKVPLTYHPVFIIAKKRN